MSGVSTHTTFTTKIVTSDAFYNGGITNIIDSSKVITKIFFTQDNYKDTIGTTQIKTSVEFINS